MDRFSRTLAAVLSSTLGALAFANAPAGTVIENVSMPTLGGGQHSLLGDTNVSVFIFIKPDRFGKLRQGGESLFASLKHGFFFLFCFLCAKLWKRFRHFVMHRLFTLNCCWHMWYCLGRGDAAHLKYEIKLPGKCDDMQPPHAFFTFYFDSVQQCAVGTSQVFQIIGIL